MKWHWSSRRDAPDETRVYTKSLDYVTSVDLWSDILPWNDHDKRQMRGNGHPMAIMWKWSSHGNYVGLYNNYVHCLVRDYPWQVLKHSQGEILSPTVVMHSGLLCVDFCLSVCDCICGSYVVHHFNSTELCCEPSTCVLHH